MKKFMILSILFFFFSTCISDYKKINVFKENKLKFYRDFDLFSMEGKYEIDIDNKTEIEIPFVEVERIPYERQEKQKVTIHFYKDYTSTYFCEKKNDYWICDSQYDEPEEGCTYYVFSQHSKDSIIRVTYCGHPEKEEDYFLSSVAIESEMKRKVFHYSRFEKRKDPIMYNINSYPLEKSIKWEQTFYSIKGDIIRDYGEIIDTNSNKIIHSSQNCFSLGGISFFWFRFSRHLLHEVNCDYYDFPDKVLDKKK